LLLLFVRIDCLFFFVVDTATTLLQQQQQQQQQQHFGFSIVALITSFFVSVTF
jgi:hypothetical protein